MSPGGSAKHIRTGGRALQPAAQQVTLRASGERAGRAGQGCRSPFGLSQLPLQLSSKAGSCNHQELLCWSACHAISSTRKVQGTGRQQAAGSHQLPPTQCGGTPPNQASAALSAGFACRAGGAWQAGLLQRTLAGSRDLQLVPACRGLQVMSTGRRQGLQGGIAVSTAGTDAADLDCQPGLRHLDQSAVARAPAGRLLHC